MTAITPSRPKIADRSPTGGVVFRGDIQGLRSIAVTAVVFYHLNLPFVPGGFVGVDVFFVISGFLITGLLIRQLQREGKISLLEFYSRRAKRLLPAATLVLLSTAALTLVLLPPTRWGSIGWDTVASSVFSQNWRLAINSVDYLAQDEAASPLQHFWSLGVEEQFYFIWPLLLILTGWLFTRKHHQASGIASKRFPLAILIGLSLVALPSLAWSIHYTPEAPGPAYFVSTTRVWELAIGAAVAAMAVALGRMPAPVASILGWAGLTGIILSVVLIDRTVPFPGQAALLPTVSTALVIAGGIRRCRFGPELLLGLAPMQFIGNISYSLYLWHWPVIVVSTALLGQMGLLTSVAAGALSLILAWVTYRFVERPLNELNYFREQPARAMQTGILLVVVVALSGTILVNTDRDNLAVAETKAYNATLPSPRLDQNDKKPRPADNLEPQGAETLPDDPRAANIQTAKISEKILPDPILAAKDWTTCGSAKDAESTVVKCVLGDKFSDVHVALIGDSHAQQWIPALDAIAAQNGWSLTAYIHDACPFATGELVRDGHAYESCIAWNAEILETLSADERLSMVVTSNFTNSAEISGTEDNVASMSEAFQSSWSQITKRKIPMVVIRDSPEPGLHIPDCVSAHAANLTDCAVPRAEAVEDRGLAQMAAARALRGVTPIDLNDFICPGETCAPVIGKVLVYRDSNHLTATYARTLRARLAKPLITLMGAA